jgi:hypothetical protein
VVSDTAAVVFVEVDGEDIHPESTTMVMRIAIRKRKIDVLTFVIGYLSDFSENL